MHDEDVRMKPFIEVRNGEEPVPFVDRMAVRSQDTANLPHIYAQSCKVVLTDITTDLQKFQAPNTHISSNTHGRQPHASHKRFALKPARKRRTRVPDQFR